MANGGFPARRGSVNGVDSLCSGSKRYMIEGRVYSVLPRFGTYKADSLQEHELSDKVFYQGHERSVKKQVVFVFLLVCHCLEAARNRLLFSFTHR